MAEEAIEGWRGGLAIGGVHMSMERWRFVETSTEISNNSFLSRRRKQKHGLVGATLEFSGYADADQLPTADDGTALRAGRTLPASAFLIADSLAISIPNFDVFEIEYDDELESGERSRVNFSCRGKTNGDYTVLNELGP